MPITLEHAFKGKSTKLLLLLPLRTSYNRTFQCETPCTIKEKKQDRKQELYSCYVFFVKYSTFCLKSILNSINYSHTSKFLDSIDFCTK